MKRRNVVIGGLAALVASSTGWYYWQNHKSSTARPEFLSLICNEKELLAIGDSYLKQSSVEAYRERLISLLPVDSQISGAIQLDFESGRTVVVDGWILSVTEARQCALYSLTR